MELYEVLLEQRFKNKISVTELSKIIEVDANTIREWEDGIKTPTEFEIKKLNILYAIDINKHLKNVIKQQKQKCENIALKKAKSEKVGNVLRLISNIGLLLTSVLLFVSMFLSFIKVSDYHSSTVDVLNFFDLFFQDLTSIILSVIVLICIGVSFIYSIVYLCLKNKYKSKMKIAHIMLISILGSVCVFVLAFILLIIGTMKVSPGFSLVFMYSYYLFMSFAIMYLIFFVLALIAAVKVKYVEKQ